MRLMLFTAFLILGLALGIAAPGPAAVEAQTPSDRLTVVVFDRESIQGSDDAAGLINSFLSLFFKLKEGQPFVFLPLDDPSVSLGPVETDREDFAEVRAQLDQMLAAPPASGASLAGTLAEVYNLLGGLTASAESVLYVVTGSQEPTNAPGMLDGLQSVLKFYTDAGWSIFTVGLPGTDPGLNSVLDEVSDATGGEAYALAVPDGMRDFADRTLRLEGKGALVEVGGGALDADTVLDLNLNIAPGTDETNMLFFKENQVTAFRFKNPEGFESSAGDRISSSMTELPNLVMWRLVGPAAGQWQIEVRGTGGRLSAWEFSTNKYALGLQAFGAVPVGQPTTVTAFITADGERTFVDDAVLSAKITAPDGMSIIHQLNDDGIDGDAVARDNYYAVTIPPLTAEGEYTVDLELAWPGFQHTINTRGSFEAQMFPNLAITPVQTELIQPGMRTKIATVFANINGQPFSVQAADIALNVATNAAQQGMVELVPQSVITQGRAYMYDLYYTPGAEALTNVSLRLTLDYAGRAHTFTTDSLILSSHLPTPTAVPMTVPTPTVVEVVRVVAPAVPTPAPVPTPVPAPAPEPSSPVPMALIVALAVLGVAIVALAIYWLTLQTPYGFLYNDQGDVVANFSELARAPLANLISRNAVRGSEIGIPGLEGVTFTFRSAGIFMSSVQVAPATVRVNNQPLIEERAIEDSVWIGASGRLYNFSTQPPRPRPEE